MTFPADASCVLFDFDGVIVDSEPVGARRNVEIFREMGVEVTFEEAMTLAGTHGDDEVPALGRAHGVECTFERFHELQVEKDRESPLYLDERLRLMPDVREFIAGLRARGIATGLVSTTASLQILQGLNRFGLASSFDAIVTGDQTPRHKPDPMPYQRGMELLGASPATTVVFEDSPTGIAAGKAAGAFVVGFEGSIVSMDTSAADARVASYADIDLA